MRSHALYRFLDRYVGIPLIIILGLFKKHRPLPSLDSKAKIGLLGTAAIGETIFQSAAIQDLQAAYPKSSITYFAGESNYEAAQLIAHINVIKITPKKPLDTIRILRRYSFDLWIDFGAWPRIDALYSWSAKAKFKMGYRTPKQYRHYVYDKAIFHRYIHETENHKNLLHVLNIKPQYLPRCTAFTERVETDPSLIILHTHSAGSQGRLKQWPEANWIALIDVLTSKGYRIVLTGSEKDATKSESIKNRCQYLDKIEVLRGRKNLRETAKLLKSACLVISIDTGIAHLAAALDCDLITLFGPTHPTRCSPKGSRVTIVRPAINYQPCIYLGFESRCKTNRCMQAITVEQVIKAVDSYVDQKKTLKHACKN